MGTFRKSPPALPALGANSEKFQQQSSSADSSTCSLKNRLDWSDRIHSFVARCYRQWAHIVVAHPIKIILLCFLLTGICAFKMSRTKHENNIRGYTPYGARSLYEFDVRDQFFGQSGTGIRFFVLVLPKVGNNILDENMLRETVEVDSFVQNNLTIFNRKTQRDEPFSVFCHRFCTINQPVNLFYVGWKDQHDRIAKGEPLNSRVELEYPFSNVYGREVNIQPNFFGVHFLGKNATSTTTNNTSTTAISSRRRVTRMERAEMIVLLYRAERVGGWNDDDIRNYEMSISNYFKNEYVGQHIRVLTISTSYAQQEVDRSGNILRSYVGLGLVVMAICSVLTTALSSAFMRQFSIYKLPVALFACLCPFIASGTALGILFFFGVRYGSILGVTPFLILAIGVDDAFLMIHSWQQSSVRRRKLAANNDGQNDEAIDSRIVEQLSEVLEDTGPAILISALTNILADLVGSYTGSDEITLLCKGNIASIVVDFIYQITLFTAVLVLCARWEFRSEAKRAQQHQRRGGDRIAPLENGKLPESTKNGGGGTLSTPPSPSGGGFRNSLDVAFQSFVALYIRLVSNIFASILICILWVALLLVCLNAMLKFEINLTTKKLFPPDSPLLEIENYREHMVLPYYTTAQLFVNNPGDLSNNTRRQHLDQLIEEMEHLPYAYPSESSLYFVRTYQSFENFMMEEEEAEAEMEEEQAGNMTETGGGGGRKAGGRGFDLADLENFLDWPEYQHWRGLINYHQENVTDQQGGRRQQFVLDSFMATVAYHGAELKDWYRRALMLQDWRRVVDKYVDEFNVSVLHDDGLYLDLLENMPTDIWQSALGTLVCMAAICALFMSNLFVVCVTTGVIASIFVETLGVMALMGMTMDPVVMAAVIISIGFSVDIPAHVSYHFHTAKWADDEGGQRAKVPRSVQERVQRAFSSVGFPALQASICTNICIGVLLFVPLYMAQVFVRVLCTCLTLCTIHSLVLLPALFTLVASVDAAILGAQDGGGGSGAENGKEAAGELGGNRRRSSVRI